MIAVRDAALWARELGISREAIDLYLESEVIDLHLDSFIWYRLLGYDLLRRHTRQPLAGWLFGHADFPRVREAGLAAATWIVTTNPLRDPAERFRTLLENLDTFEGLVRALPDDLALVRTHAEYRAARSAGKHGVFLGIQGGNALEEPADAVERLAALRILRVTLMHLSNSRIGSTSSPLGAGPLGGLNRFGRELVERLESARIFVDLAHARKQTFWDAVDAHDPGLPLLVTHTGVCGAHRHWRNLDDAQLRAIADSGGVVGIMFHAAYLGDWPWAGKAEHVVDHIAHALRVAGEDAVAIGSDFDGNIIPPRDLRSVLELPRLVEILLRRGVSAARVQKLLGRNFLRVLQAMRP